MGIEVIIKWQEYAVFHEKNIPIVIFRFTVQTLMLHLWGYWFEVTSPSPSKNTTCRPAVLFRDKMEDKRPHLLWVANTLLACPRPLQPGKGQWGSSCLLAFQAKGSPLMDDSFCLLAASGQLPALRWDVYFPDIWPCPSHPITGHLPERHTNVVNLHSHWAKCIQCELYWIISLCYNMWLH